MIKHNCGSVIPPDIETYVRHLASCPDSGREIAAWCHAIVSSVAYEQAHGETAETPTETQAVSTTVPDIEELAILRDGGMSYRDLANVAGVAPETVRRRIAKHKREGGA